VVKELFFTSSEGFSSYCARFRGYSSSSGIISFCRVRLESIVGVARESFSCCLCNKGIVFSKKFVSRFFATHNCNVFEDVVMRSGHFHSVGVKHCFIV
jgi:hypothetical protein